eukprot:2668618-Rhodomonas_salina.1
MPTCPALLRSCSTVFHSVPQCSTVQGAGTFAEHALHPRCLRPRDLYYTVPGTPIRRLSTA